MKESDSGMQYQYGVVIVDMVVNDQVYFATSKGFSKF